MNRSSRRFVTRKSGGLEVSRARARRKSEQASTTATDFTATCAARRACGSGSTMRMSRSPRAVEDRGDAASSSTASDQFEATFDRTAARERTVPSSSKRYNRFPVMAVAQWHTSIPSCPAAAGSMATCRETPRGIRGQARDERYREPRKKCDRVLCRGELPRRDGRPVGPMNQPDAPRAEASRSRRHLEGRPARPRLPER